MRRLFRLSVSAALVIVACLIWSPAPEAQTLEETPEVLPEGKGRDETFYGCTACHGTALVKAQGMTRTQWDSTIDWMIERHGMPEPDAAERALILDYLAEHFPPRQRGRPNPFLNR